MGINRRSFLKVLGGGIVGGGIAGVASGNIVIPKKLKAEETVSPQQFVGILVDTTRCVGCRACEEACAQANHLPVPDISDNSVLEKERKTTQSQLTVVSRYQTEKGEVFVKKQCMHCNQPGCVAACLVKAMEKRKEGPVTWASNCMGCRYCMPSCPFEMPKFEYESSNPRIQKCSLCWDRIEKGEKPACVDACPEKALTFGPRRKLIEEANRRIYQKPGEYLTHIYGEHEVGGTGYLYISEVPFEQIGFRTDLGTIPYPEFSKGFLYAVPIVLLLWPAFLIGVNTITKREEEIRRKGEGRR
ncbi:MAG: 4Fe-4S dicluster domain-containing protein [Deltaproteobacteria bacterium]|nr:4Fe-4S dicluster domain-containing protein [Deltaproteobacteria bacterium]